MVTRLESHVRAHLHALEEQALRRALHPPSGIDLCSNDYLGLSQHPAVKARLIEAVRREGCGSSGSRLLRGHRDAFEAVERAFAAFKGCERALYFSSGYLANLAVLTAFAGPDDLILSDRLNHASLKDGARLSQASRAKFRHNDAAALARRLDAARVPGQVFIVTESLFSMDGDTAPLAEYATLCDASGALLVVDEAHAVGVCGADGSGLLDRAAAPQVLVSVNTAGKALGVAGAFVAGPAWAIEYLIQRARPFVFSTAPPPALAAALETSLTLVSTEPERRARVHELAAHLRTRLHDIGVSTVPGNTHIVPVILGDVRRTVSVAQVLQTQGFDVRAIRPPTVPAGTARLRISVNAGLTAAVLDRFVDALAAALEEVAPCRAACS